MILQKKQEDTISNLKKQIWFERKNKMLRDENQKNIERQNKIKQLQNEIMQLKQGIQN